jgi:hypothetical protein
MRRPLIPLSITAADQVRLQAWSKRPNPVRVLAMRFRVVLLAASGSSNTAIARRLALILLTAGKCRHPAKLHRAMSAVRLTDHVATFPDSMPAFTPRRNFGETQVAVSLATPAPKPKSVQRLMFLGPRDPWEGLTDYPL